MVVVEKVVKVPKVEVLMESMNTINCRYKYMKTNLMDILFKHMENYKLKLISSLHVVSYLKHLHNIQIYITEHKITFLLFIQSPHILLFGAVLLLWLAFTRKPCASVSPYSNPVESCTSTIRESPSA